MTIRHRFAALSLAALAACAPATVQTSADAAAPSTAASTGAVGAQDSIDIKLARYTPVRLTTDLPLSQADRRMIPLLIDAAREMDALFKLQAYGNLDSLLASIRDPRVRRYAEINYGPWDRLAGNAPFIPGVGAKPEGANLYPADLTRAELEAQIAAGGARADSLKSLYTLVRRGADGRLTAVPYHQAFAAHLRRAADRLRQAAALAEDPGLRRYLELRAQALVTDDYQPSDFAWLDMKTNPLDVVIGPIETYEDALFGYKASYEAYVLIKD
jgi:hypothetical protein